MMTRTVGSLSLFIIDVHGLAGRSAQLHNQRFFSFWTFVTQPNDSAPGGIVTMEDDTSVMGYQAKVHRKELDGSFILLIWESTSG